MPGGAVGANIAEGVASVSMAGGAAAAKSAEGVVYMPVSIASGAAVAIAERKGGVSRRRPDT